MYARKWLTITEKARNQPQWQHGQHQCRHTTGLLTGTNLNSKKKIDQNYTQPIKRRQEPPENKGQDQGGHAKQYRITLVLKLIDHSDGFCKCAKTVAIYQYPQS